MIVVEVKLKSAVHKSRDRQLCRMEVVNDGTRGDAARADYLVRLYSRSNSLIRTARVENWPRRAKPAWRLIQAAFEAVGE